MADGSITFKTALDNSDLEKQMRRAEQKVERLKNKVEGSQIDRTLIEKQMERAGESIDRARGKIAELESQLEAMGSPDDMDASQLRAATEITKQINEQYEALERQRAKLGQLGDAWSKANEKVDTYGTALQGAQSRSERLSGEYAKSQQRQEMYQQYEQAQAKARELREAAVSATADSTSAWQRFGNGVRETFSGVATNVRERMANVASQAVSPWQSFASRINTMLRKVFVFGVILSGIRALKNELGSMLMQNRQFNASVENLKSIMRGFLGQMVQMVLPVLTGVVNTLAQAFQRIASFIDSVFGTNIMANIDQQRQQSSDAVQQANAQKMAEYDAQVAKERERYEKQVAAAEERQAKAAQKLEKAQKKANQQLFAFDELNKMAEDSSEDAADALEDYMDGIEEPDYSGIEPPQLETDWTQDLVPDAGIFKGVLDWLDMLRDRILKDVEGPFARIREGLQLMKQGWDEIVQGIQNGDWGLVWKGVGDVVLGALYVIEGAFGALMDWLDEQTGGRFHDIFEGLKLIVHGFVEVVEGLLRGDLPLAFQGLMDMLDGLTLTVHGIIDAISGFVHSGVDGIFEYLKEKLPQFEGPLSDLQAFAHGIIDTVTKYLHDKLDGARQFIGGVLDVIVGLLTLDADRVLRGVTGMFDGMKRNLQALIDFFKGMIGNAFNLLRNSADRTFNSLAEKFPQLRGLFEGLRIFVNGHLDFFESSIRGVLDGVGRVLGGALEGAKQAVRGAIDVIVGIFTGSGDRIVRGLKGIVNGFISVVEGILDGVIVGVVGFVNGIAAGLSNIPGVDIPSITFRSVNLPRLAGGAVIPPNREFLAVLGDQKGGNNIETPEALMRQVVREEVGPLLADVVAALLNGGGSGQSQDVVLMVGRKELARETLRGMRELSDSRELGMTGIVFG